MRQGRNQHGKLDRTVSDETDKGRLKLPCPWTDTMKAWVDNMSYGYRIGLRTAYERAGEREGERIYMRI